MLLTFFAIAFGFTWFFHAVLLRRFLPFDSSKGQLIYILGLPGPLIAALILASLSDVQGGLQGLLDGILHWRAGLMWWALALLSMLGINLLAAFISELRSGKSSGMIFHKPASGWMWLGVSQVYVAFSEEVGWRGFALPLLIEQFGSLGAALVLGVVWSIWHLPMFSIPGSNQTGSFLRYMIGTTSRSVLLTVIYTGSGGSILLCMLFHAVTNAWFFTMTLPADADRYADNLTVLAALTVLPLLPHPWWLV